MYAARLSSSLMWDELLGQVGRVELGTVLYALAFTVTSEPLLPTLHVSLLKHYRVLLSYLVRVQRLATRTPACTTSGCM